MKRLTFTLGTLLTGAALAQPLASPAQQSPSDQVRVTAFPKGIFQLRQGRLIKRVDLQNALPGCTTGGYDISDPNSPPTGGAYDSDPSFVTGGAAQTRVIDLVRKNGWLYLTFQAGLGSSCNVQGLCGAGTALSLVWLKLDARLRPVARQVEPVNECFTETVLTGWEKASSSDNGNPDDVDLEMVGGVLDITYQQSDFVAQTQTDSRLIYRHARPELGLQISSKRVPLK